MGEMKEGIWRRGKSRCGEIGEKWKTDGGIGEIKWSDGKGEREMRYERG